MIARTRPTEEERQECAHRLFAVAEVTPNMINGHHGKAPGPLAGIGHAVEPYWRRRGDAPLATVLAELIDPGEDAR